MMTRTNAEWATVVAETNTSLVVSDKPYDCPGVGSTAFAKTIDHTLLKLDSKPEQFEELCTEARENMYASVCVRPQYVQQCVSNLKGTGIKVASVIGFHKGDYDLPHKMQETKQALQAGALELDIVLNYNALKAGDYGSIYEELSTLRLQAASPVVLKLIVETSQLDRHQIIAACAMAAAANFDFVKTSTGFNGQGATVENVRLMAACCETLANGGRKKMRVKASGGIRTLDDAIKMLEAGASRLGTSGGVRILKEANEYVERSRSSPSVSETTDSKPGMTMSSVGC